MHDIFFKLISNDIFCQQISSSFCEIALGHPVNIASGNGLVLSVKKPLSEQMLTQIYVGHVVYSVLKSCNNMIQYNIIMHA